MYRSGFMKVARSICRAMILSAVAVGLIGGALAGVEGAINGVILGGSFGLMGGVLSLLGYFFLDDSQSEADLRWHGGWGPDDTFP